MPRGLPLGLLDAQPHLVEHGLIAKGRAQLVVLRDGEAERISELATLVETCIAVLARHRLHCRIQDLLHRPRHLRIPAAFPLVVAREGEQLLELALPLELLLARRRRARPGRRRGRSTSRAQCRRRLTARGRGQTSDGGRGGALARPQLAAAA